jgi:excisionase family DNA binding protein
MPKLKKKWQSLESVAAPALTPISDREYFNLEQAASYLSVTVWTIRGLIAEGKLPYRKLGKRFIVKRSDIDTMWQQAA